MVLVSFVLHIRGTDERGISGGRPELVCMVWGIGACLVGIGLVLVVEEVRIHCRRGDSPGLSVGKAANEAFSTLLCDCWVCCSKWWSYR